MKDQALRKINALNEKWLTRLTVRKVPEEHLIGSSCSSYLNFGDVDLGEMAADGLRGIATTTSIWGSAS